MKTKHLKFAAVLAVAVVGLAVSFRSGVYAQDAQDKQALVQISTNWMGCLVIGKKESGDAIVIGGPFPQAKAEFEIGLRSDGLVVWRKTRL